jgi:hypothetical protein
MNLDMSVAPEIALLAQPGPVPAQSGGGGRATVGTLAAELRVLASHPERWWSRVGFNRGRSEKIDLEFPGFSLAVLFPGDAGVDCDCTVMTVVAGTVIEESVADGGGVTTELLPGRIRVHGQGQVHQLRAGGDGYAVTLHTRGSASRGMRNHHLG